ncbi:MAG: hypothetical protein KAW56_07555, partial [Candidatus Marinimicrobia bacterium]|nr:hypothetical protein [Candidatus Neomarinimicrobiota bacterium]
MCLSNSVSPASENWIITCGNFDLGTQPFSVAVRFFGEHITADVGALTMLERYSKRGFQYPDLHFSNQFSLYVVQAEIGLLSVKMDTINNRNEHDIELEYIIIYDS